MIEAQVQRLKELCETEIGKAQEDTKSTTVTEAMTEAITEFGMPID